MHFKMFCLLITATLSLVAIFPPTASASNLTSTDPYEVLGLHPYAEDRELTIAWRRLIQIHHPDYGGNDVDAQNLNEAYQFLKKNRNEYDQRILPFRDVYKEVESRSLVVVGVPETEDHKRYRGLYKQWLDQEPRARDLASRFRGGKIFIFFGTMNLSRTPRDFRQFTPWQVEAYIDLVSHLDLFSLTKAEFTWITLHNPVDALSSLFEHYDNFNVRFDTVIDLIRSYKVFYLEDDRSSKDFLQLMERMANNNLLFELRYKAFHKEISNALKAWIGSYLDKSKTERRELLDQYTRTMALLKKVDSFTGYSATCSRILFGIKPPTE